MKDVMSINHNEVTVRNIEPVEKVCKCCNKTFMLLPFIEQPLCNRCYQTAVKMLFSGLYDDLSAAEFRQVVKKEVLEAGNEKGN